MASLGSIQQELVNMQSNTAVNKAKEQAANGASQELDGDAFLMLMLEQLKNQAQFLFIGANILRNFVFHG